MGYEVQDMREGDWIGERGYIFIVVMEGCGECVHRVEIIVEWCCDVYDVYGVYIIIFLLLFSSISF